MGHNNKDNLSSLIGENVTNYANMTTMRSDTSWLILILDRSQLVMTIVGIIVNLGTSITLIKNGQVGVELNGLCCFTMLASSDVKEMI